MDAHRHGEAKRKVSFSKTQEATRSKLLHELEELSKHRHSSEVVHSCAIGEDVMFRRVWNMVLVILLLYVGTVLPYVICFEQLRIRGESDAGALSVTYYIVDAMFYLDLGLNFFFTYKDSAGIEVFDLRLIAKNYLKGRFLLDVVACLPSAVWIAILQAASAKSGLSTSGVYKLTRLARLQRVSRLARMASLSKWLEQLNAKKPHPLIQWLKGVASVRIVNFIGTLFWFVHLLACGWYLCAALHLHEEDTWVARRTIDGLGTPLVEASPAVNWFHSMYFVLTVFTTVGFGDIIAMSVGEIVYVSFTMLVGAVVHSTIVSEIIGIVTALDTEEKEASRRMRTVDDFAFNTGLDQSAKVAVKQWIQSQAQRGHLAVRFDREAAKNVFLDGTMPNDILHKLPTQVFGGRLLDSHLVQVLYCSRGIPPRLVLSLAVAITRRQCFRHEVVYQIDDQSTHLYVVDYGIFALVTKPDNSIYNHPTNSMQRAWEESTPLPGEVVEKSHMPRRWRGSSKSNQPKKPDFRSHGSKHLGGGDSHDEIDFRPFKLYTKGNYFGDGELFIKRPRSSSARCESHDGVLLGLGLDDLNEIMKIFPQFRRVWSAEAQRHMRSVLMSLKRVQAESLEDAAARLVQQHWRRMKSRGDRVAFHAIRFASMCESNSNREAKFFDERNSLGMNDMGSVRSMPSSESEKRRRKAEHQYEREGDGIDARNPADRIIRSKSTPEGPSLRQAGFVPDEFGRNRLLTPTETPRDTAAIEVAVQRTASVLRKEFSQSIASLRTELLDEMRKEIRRGFADLRRAEEAD